MCNLCKGTGDLICFPGGKPEWWNCPSCDGDGTRMMFCSPIVKINEKQSKMSRKWGKLHV